MANQSRDPTPPPSPSDAESERSVFNDPIGQDIPPRSLEPSLGAADIRPPDPHIGTPVHDSSLFPGQQSYPDTCAIRCQEFILEQFTGMDISEDALIQQAAQHGWYSPGGGTLPADVGNLLELHGVGVERYVDATIFHLANELAQGHKVIIGLDSGELWDRHPILDRLADCFGLSGADHAVVVSGIDTTDPDNVQVIISDPGSGEPAASYPLNQFLDAWQDSGFFMVATEQPAPSWLPEMLHFDYGLGHLPYVAGMPYDQFLSLEHQPAAWDDLLHYPTQLMPPEVDQSGWGVDTMTAEQDLYPDDLNSEPGFAMDSPYPDQGADPEDLK